MDRQKAKKRAEELVSKMTVEEACSQLRYDSPAIERLGIPEYNWWNESLHGVARAGTATSFPQAIGLGATFDTELMGEVGEVCGNEGRAKYNEYKNNGDRDIYKGLTFWSPNVNLFRDPRWGRGQETYGEDPVLISRLAVPFIEGLQGDGEYMKAAACAKHFVVHSGPEAVRHQFNATCNDKDLYETYMPAFEACVKEAKVESVMGAYNRTNGEPCCGHSYLQDVIRDKWDFEGHIVSDCWAIRDFHENHKITNSPAESAAMALKAGCDLNCGNTYLCILGALKDKLITEDQMREACVRLMKTRMKLGILPRSEEDAVKKTSVYDKISYLENDTPENNAVSLEASRKSIVLLENNGVLPLKEGEYKTIGVVGPTSNLRSVLEGNYFGTASTYVTNLEGIKAATKARVLCSDGAHLYQDSFSNLSKKDDRMAEAIAVTRNSDVTILCLGLDAMIEGEEGDTGNMFASGDKMSLNLPESQLRPANNVIKTAKEYGKKIVVVLNAGSAIDLSFLKNDVDAIVDCWYSGEFGGTALAEVLFGKVNPYGKLPITFYKDGEQPDFTDYAMKNRTYRYYKGEALYPFGYGLSYTKFDYDLSGKVTGSVDDSDYMALQKTAVTLDVTVKNSGDYDGEEVVLAYVDKCPSEKGIDADNQPIKSLCAFKRVSLKKGESKKVSLEITGHSLTTVLDDGTRKFLPGKYIFTVGDKKLELEV
jgi:beta-glucosidase